MDHRKLIEFGNGSYILTMPRSWVKNNQLKKGDLVTMDDKGNELVLEAKATPFEEKPSEITISASGKDMVHIQMEIITAYLNCYESIIIHTKNSESNSQHIKNTLRNLSGMEIMEHSSSRIAAKNILNPMEISIESMIRRMDGLIRSIIEDATLCIEGQYSPDVLIERDADVNRLYLLGSRSIKNAMLHPKLSRLMGKSPWELHSDRLMLIRLEKSADFFKRIARMSVSAGLEKESIAELSRLFSSFKEYFEDVMKSYYTKDKEAALRQQVSIRSPLDDCGKFLENLNMRILSLKKSPQQKAEAQIAAVYITENLKSAFVQLKYMARYISSY